MTQWAPRLRAVDGGGEGESATSWLRRVGPKLREASDRAAVEDASDLKRRLRTAALRADQVYDEAKAIIGDLEVDGHGRAAAKVKLAVLRLKQAEDELEQARELVMAEGPRS